MRGSHRGDPVREHERLIERYGTVEENLRDRRLLENRLETQERGNPVDLLAASRLEYLEPIIERGQIVRAQEHGDPAGQALANQLPTILIRAAAQVVIEHHANGRAACQPRQHALHGVDVIERRRPEVLRSRLPHDPAQVAVPQPSPGRAREPDELAEFPVTRLARFHRVRDVELEPPAVVKRNSSTSLRAGCRGGYPVTTKPEEPALRSSGKTRSTSGAHESEMDRQPLLPAVAFEQQRDFLDRMRRMRDHPQPKMRFPLVTRRSIPNCSSRSLCSLMVASGKGPAARFERRSGWPPLVLGMDSRRRRPRRGEGLSF